MHSEMTPGFRAAEFANQYARLTTEPGCDNAPHRKPAITVEPSHIHISRPGRILQFAVEKMERDGAALGTFA